MKYVKEVKEEVDINSETYCKIKTEVKAVKEEDDVSFKSDHRSSEGNDRIEGSEKVNCINFESYHRIKIEVKEAMHRIEKKCEHTASRRFNNFMNKIRAALQLRMLQRGKGVYQVQDQWHSDLN